MIKKKEAGKLLVIYIPTQIVPINYTSSGDCSQRNIFFLPYIHYNNIPWIFYLTFFYDNDDDFNITVPIAHRVLVSNTVKALNFENNDVNSWALHRRRWSVFGTTRISSTRSFITVLTAFCPNRKSRLWGGRAGRYSRAPSSSFPLTHSLSSCYTLHFVFGNIKWFKCGLRSENRPDYIMYRVWRITTAGSVLVDDFCILHSSYSCK